MNVGDQQVRDRAQSAQTHTQAGGTMTGAGQQHQGNTRSTSRMTGGALWGFLEELFIPPVLLCTGCSHQQGSAPDIPGVAEATRSCSGGQRSQQDT